jgi:hypothetical protein
VLATVTNNPRSAAASITPEAIVEKYGSATSCTTRPNVAVVPRAMAWAWAFGE